jgi:hypothetical protein
MTANRLLLAAIAALRRSQARPDSRPQHLCSLTVPCSKRKFMVRTLVLNQAL